MGWVLVGCTALAAACSPGSDDQAVLVFGASSLTDVLLAAQDRFEAVNPDIDVQVNLAGSSSLREQILNGAPADVVIPANLAILEELHDAGELADEFVDVTVVARNRIVIAVPPGNPADIAGLESFARSELLLGVCNPAVPCGALAYESFEVAGVAPSIDTEEPDVRSLLTKIAEGELDAGIVYVTDVVSARGAVQTVDLPVSAALATDYGAAVTANANQPELAEDFIDFLTSEEGRELFRRRGFVTP